MQDNQVNMFSAIVDLVQVYLEQKIEYELDNGILKFVTSHRETHPKLLRALNDRILRFPKSLWWNKMGNGLFHRKEIEKWGRGGLPVCDLMSIQLSQHGGKEGL